jgi:hypothetical protein
LKPIYQFNTEVFQSRAGKRPIQNTDSGILTDFDGKIEEM